MSAVVVVSGVATAAVLAASTGLQGPPGPPVAAGAAGQFYVTNDAATSGVWATMSGDASADAVTVGKLTVTGLQGRALSAAAPSAGNTLGWSGTAWAPSALNLAGGANYVTGVLPIANIAPGTAGQIFVSNATPNATWTSLISYETVHGRFTAGGGGTDYKAIIGPDIGVETLASALWLIAKATNATSSNYAVNSDGTSVTLNAPGGGNIDFFSANSSLIARMSTVAFSLNVPAITFLNTIGAPTISQNTVGSDVAAVSITIFPQGPFATATINKSPGNLIVQTPLPISGASFNGGLVWNRGDGTPGWRLGYYGGPDLTYTSMWFNDAGTPSSTGYAFLGTATRTDINAQTVLNLAIASAYQINIAGTTSMQMTTNANVTGSLTFGTGVAGAVLVLVAGAVAEVARLTTTDFTMGGFGSTAAAPLRVNYTTTTTPLLQTGTSATSFTVGTNKAAASLVLQGDAATTILTLTTLASFATKVRLAAVAAPAAPPASFFDEYMDTADGALKVISPAGHITTIGAA